jgi:hypothetical protein
LPEGHAVFSHDSVVGKKIVRVSLCGSVANLKKHQMRKSNIYLAFISGCITVLAFLLLIHPHLNAQYFEDSLKKKRQLVKILKITDLCIFTEARYTRHLSQADHFAAFQDHPMAFEHFPSGSLVLPPVTIHRRERGER